MIPFEEIKRDLIKTFSKKVHMADSELEILGILEMMKDEIKRVPYVKKNA